ncbi:MAG: sigma-70 family RNA polymerase sigma factor, partial [Phycisphaerales bacterium]|nr:sigma-70 family RNA polymerase sigma factor [Phycisphaerales bacterium]
AADRVQRDVRAESPADAEDIARVRLAIDQLSIEGRAILVMRYGRDMSTQTIAAALGIREGTVKSRLHHARNEVKSILERSTQ